MFSGKKPDCVRCGFVLVLPANFEVMELITFYQNSFVNPMAGFNADSIISIIELEGVEDKVGTLRKILLYLSVYISKQSEETDGKTNRTRIRSNRQSVRGS
jgi:hypothetical protein